MENLGNGLRRERDPNNPDGWVYSCVISCATPVDAAQASGPGFERWIRQYFARSIRRASVELERG